MNVRFVSILMTLLAMLSWVGLSAQSDIVCGSDPVGTYYVEGWDGSTFTWDAGADGIITGQGNDTVVVEWLNGIGTYTLTVFETSAAGCDGPLQTLIIEVVEFSSTTDITICGNQLPFSWNSLEIEAAGTFDVTLTSVAGCDSIATLNLTINDVLTSLEDVTICSNQLPYNWNGTDYTAGGTYDVTLTSVAGCDSIATLNLIINDVLTSLEDVTICSNQLPYNWNGTDYTAAGTYDVTLTSVAGCDSIATLNLTINDVLTSLEDVTICSNQLPYNWNGTDYTAAGTYDVTLTSVAGCDSIATLNLMINDVLTSLENVTICSNQLPYNWNGTDYTSAGIYDITLTSVAGCDSIATLNLTINDVLTSIEDVAICSNQLPYSWNGTDYTAAGTYDVTLTSAAGCDSIATLNLTINDVLASLEDVTICSNQLPYNWNGTDYTAAGTYDITLTSVAGCDSIATLNLTINDVLTSIEDVAICSNQLPYNWNGTDYTSAGTYDVTLTSSAGCDSIATLNLTINDVLTSLEDVTICSNQLPYNWNGTDYNAAGAYDVTLTSIAGCDSIATLNLTINDVLASLEDVTICSNQLPYSWNGADYTSAGIYDITLTSAAGCDSIATLNLTINDVLTSLEDITICSNQLPYNWNGADYTAAGTYDITLTSAAGCDSIATLNLTINDVLASLEDVTICSNQLPYNWNGTDYTSAGTYDVTLTSVAGCDSIATLSLTINDVLTSLEDVTICSNQLPYNWNGTDYNAAGAYDVTLTSVAGCDSIATLNLSINDVLTSLEEITICSNQLPYNWNGVDYSSAGTYDVTLTSAAGCDSIATLNLTINDVLTSLEDITICSNQLPFNWNGSDYTAAGTYDITLTSVAGCDSIATLNLSINDVLTSTEDITICSNQLPYNWNGTDYTAAGTYDVTLTSAAGCDSIATLNLTINDVLASLEDVTICSNQLPYNWNGTDYTAAGTYDVTLVSVAGCDSIATLNLIINDVLTSLEDVTICSNQLPYNWNGTDYTAAGTYDVTLTSVTGCDSIATLNLSINDVLTSLEDVTICSNQLPYNWNGTDYTAAGTYDVTLTSVAGCDSIATLNLTINDVLTSIEDVTICSNQLPYNWNGIDYNAAGTYDITLTSAAGCDSIATLNLTINDVLTSTENVTICSNQLPYSWNGADYTAAGTYDVTLTSVAGCDSIATLNLAINDVLTSIEDVTICSNQLPYSWNGTDYTAAGTYDITLTSVAGCDSIATLNLIINDVLTSLEEITICSNQLPYNWNGTDYTAAGTYDVTLTSVAGCDSIATLNLTINDVLTSLEDVTICSNQLPYSWNGADYTAAGTYDVTLTSVAGCDSIATLNLTINDVLTSLEDVTICSNQLPYNWNGTDYTVAGTFDVTLTSVAGCDSIATLNLTINDVLTSLENVTICSNQLPYNWNGTDYTAAGTFDVTLTSVAGCDSIATLNLMINDVLTSLENVTICSNQLPYNWNGTDYTAGGTYDVTLTSVAGCDSIATLNLTINDVLTSLEDVTICSNQLPYNWNGTDYTSAGTYDVTLTSVAGCDSIATLNLTINDVLTSIEDVTICSNQLPYNWNGTDYTAAGTYDITLTSAAGCDSIATLNLTINDVLTSLEDVTICSNQLPYNWNGTDYTSAGTYDITLTSVAGCDSIATLNLTINDVLTSLEDVTICSNQLPYNWNGADYTAAGTYDVTLTSVAGCDSIATLNLTINDVLASLEDVTICSNQLPYNWNGTDYTAAGTYDITLTSVAGCDSIATLNLTINDVLTSLEEITICSNQLPYNWNGADYTAAGTYDVTLTSAAGCDSIATLNLTINDVLTSLEDVTICSNQLPYNWNGTDYNAAGTFDVTLTSVAGCDSIATLNLSINDVLTSLEDVTICSNQLPYNWNGTDYNAAGTFDVTLTSVAGCDSIATLNLSINDVLTSLEDVAICSNQLPYSWNGTDYTAAGTYDVTLTSAAGCDSIATLNLTINDVLASLEDVTICSNQLPYNWNGTDYTAAGTYDVTLTSVAGCDSIATLNLTINDVLTSLEDVTICSNQLPYSWNGADYTAAGTYDVTLTSAAGCDSIATLNLTINDVLYSTEDVTVCSNQLPYNWNGTDYTAAGTYDITLTSVAGCDSIATLNLTINDVLTSLEDVTICSNQLPYNWNGTDYTAAGTYDITLTSVAGCDSIATLNLTINDVLTSIEDVTICSNQLPYSWNGSDYTAAGTYDATLTSITGCDSIATLSLTINNVLFSTEDVTVCSNQLPYNWNGTEYTVAGTYDVTLTSAAGCDSIATLNLTINDVLTSIEDVAICSNQLPYSWNGSDYTVAGTYDVTLTSVTGCDSIATLNLTINDVLTSIEDVAICSNQLPYSWNGSDYTVAGTYDVTLTSVTGCDSIATLNLTINDVLTSIEYVAICSNQLPYSWNGSDYTAAGTYEITLTSGTGCDSIATLNLTINDVLTSIEDVAICSNQLPYSWNGSDYTAAGTYDVTLTSITGCDSIATLSLTIINVLYSTEDVTVCSNQLPYSWNGQNYTISGSYTTTLQTIAGCDSLATLNLQVIEVLNSTEEIIICNNQTPYLWNGVNYSASGLYTVVLTSMSGCDSIANLNLVINDVVYGEEFVTLCADALPYIWNGSEYNGGGTYSVTLTSSSGCDSVATLNLLVYDILTSNETFIICENDLPFTWNGSDYFNSGIYQQTLQSIHGCDSIATMVLEINPSYLIEVAAQICSGDSYFLPDGTTVSAEGEYPTLFSTINGCDSLIITQLSYFENPSLSLFNLVGTNTLNCNIGIIEYSAVSDGAISWSPSGPVFTSEGEYTVTATSPNGCSVSESVEILEDFELPQIDIINVTGTTELTCAVEEIELTATGGIAYFWNGGEVLSNHININTPGIYSVEVVGLNGCSDVMEIEITQDITPPVASITNETGTDLLTCYVTEINLQGSGNGSFVWNGLPSATGSLSVTSPGTYMLVVTASNGCTDVTSYEVYQNINTPEPTYLEFEICDDQSISLPDGTMVNTTGTFNTVLPAWNGCDSLIVTHLIVHPSYESEFNARICPGDEYLLPNGQSVSQSGSYLSSLQTNFGCDSLILTNIEVLQTYDVNFNIVICPGESYALPDGTVTTEEGAYSQMLQSIGGCDSIVTFNLDIYQPVIVNQNVYICSGEIYQLPNGNFVNTTGNYAVALQSVFGCDSTVVYHVNVNAPMQQFVNTSICQGTTYTLADGSSVAQSGVYSVTVPSIAGCDSTIITNLSVQPDIDVNFTPYGDTLYICYGESVTLAGTGAQNYDWYPNDFIDIISNNTALASPPSDMMYYLNGTTGSCADGDSLFIVVMPLPDVSALADETVLCQGDSTYIQAFGGDSYVWTPALNNGCISCEGAYISPMETTTYQVSGMVDGCETSYSVTIEVGAEPLALLPPDTLICENESLVLIAQGGGSYLWSTGEETQSITVSPTQPNEYSVIVSIGSCSDTASISIGLLPLPDIYAGPDTSIVLGGTVTLDPSGGVDYTWEYSESLSCLSCTHPDASPIITTTYVVIGENEIGCRSLDSVDVIVSVLCDNFFIPNAFAPAEGGHAANDCFKVFGTDCFEEYVIRIYNRWGQVVFESSNPEDCWDGSYKGVDLNTAVFVYYFEGKLLTGEPYHQQGNVTLMK